MTSRLARSPVAPKITTTHGSGFGCARDTVSRSDGADVSLGMLLRLSLTPAMGLDDRRNRMHRRLQPRRGSRGCCELSSARSPIDKLPLSAAAHGMGRR